MMAQRLILSPGPLVDIEEFEVPSPGPGQILVRVTTTCVSSGSEMNFFRINPPGSPPIRRTTGYMAVGRVVEVGPDVQEYTPGDLVLTRGKHGNYWLVDLNDPDPDPIVRYIQKLDGAIPEEQAGFTILADIALQGVRRATLQIDESVAVFGAGMVGQLIMQFARLSGAYPIIAVDLFDSRLEQARISGATHLVNAKTGNAVAAVRDITAGAGAETVFHATPIANILQTTMEAAANRGKVILAGSAPGIAEIGLQVELLRHELTIIGAYETKLTQPHPYWPWNLYRNRRACLRLLKSGELRLDHLISHVVPYTRAQEMYAMMARGGDDWLGIAFKWD